jgi:hypothetical protein
MGKKTYMIDGHLYLIDDETGKIKEVVIKETNIPSETLEKLIVMIAAENKNK